MTGRDLPLEASPDSAPPPSTEPSTGVHRKPALGEVVALIPTAPAAPVAPAAQAEPPALALCGHPPGATPRRGLCHRCYRKLREADCPLPPKLVPGPATLDPLVSWVCSLPDDVRRRIGALLMETTDGP